MLSSLLFKRVGDSCENVEEVVRLLNQGAGDFSIHHISTAVAQAYDTIIHHQIIVAGVVGGAVVTAHFSSLLYHRFYFLGSHREPEK